MTCAAERLAAQFGHYIIGPVDRSPSPRTSRSIILPTVADDSMWQAWTMGGSSIRGRLPQQQVTTTCMTLRALSLPLPL